MKDLLLTVLFCLVAGCVLAADVLQEGTMSLSKHGVDGQVQSQSVYQGSAPPQRQTSTSQTSRTNSGSSEATQAETEEESKLKRMMNLFKKNVLGISEDSTLAEEDPEKSELVKKLMENYGAQMKEQGIDMETLIKERRYDEILNHALNSRQLQQQGLEELNQQLEENLKQR